MTARQIELFLIGYCIVAALVLAITAILPAPAHAHSWYSKKTDPVWGNSCCGGSDCATWAIRPGSLSAEDDGYRVRLTLEETRKINPYSTAPIDALVTWDRVQPSEDGNWHLCVMTTHRDNNRGGIYCLFAPPNI